MKKILLSVLAALAFLTGSEAFAQSVVTYGGIPSVGQSCTDASGNASTCYLPAYYSFSGAGGATNVQGNVASGATDSGNPLKIGGYGSASAPTAVTAGQRVNGWFNLFGAQVGIQSDNGGNIVANSTSGTSDGTTLTRGFLGFSTPELVGNAGLTSGTRARDLIGAGSGGTGAGVAATGNIPASVQAVGLVPVSAQAASSDLVKASAGELYGMYAENGAVAGYVLVTNYNAVPSGGAAIPAGNLLWAKAIAANGEVDRSFNVPIYASAGIVLLCSSSLTTYTAITCNVVGGQGI